MIISFSGLDGAGKTTQLRIIVKRLEDDKYQVITKRVYADCIYLKLGEIFKRIAPKRANSLLEYQYKNRSPKGFKKNLLRLFRQICFMLDLFLFYIKYYLRYNNSKKIILCDRYFPDVLVQMLYAGMCSDYFLAKITKCIPRCSISFLLLDEVEKIIRRKKLDYDLDYYYCKNKLYRGLADYLDFQIIENKSLEDAAQIIYKSVKKA